MPVVIIFGAVYCRWSRKNNFTRQTLIVLRSKVSVSGLLKQVKKELFSQKPCLCLHVLSLLSFVLFFYFMFIQRTKVWLPGSIHEPSETVQQILLALLPD